MNWQSIVRLLFTMCMLFLLQKCSTAVNQESDLKLQKTILLTGVSGRIDHLAFDSARQIVFVAALGNNSVEVIDLKTGSVIHSIKNLDEPQGIVYIPESNSIFVANGGNGKCNVYDAGTFQLKSSLSLSEDADNVRYDSKLKKVFVGYGSGGIAIIDAGTFQQVGNIALTAHPESFHIDDSKSRIFVNVPDSHEVDVIDLNTNSVVSRWHPQSKSNFPMALDGSDHRLFLGCRSPAKLEILDSESGKTIMSLDCSGDADDIFYNRSRKEIYASCGAGSIDIFSQKDADHYERQSQVALPSGSRTSLFIPQLNQIIVACPASLTKSARLLIYTIQ